MVRWPHARVWYTVGVLMTLAVVITMLLPSRLLPTLAISDKLEHAATFALLALWFAGLIELRGYVWLGLLLLVLGGAIEIAQGLMSFGRQADVRDLFADGAGILAGLALALMGLRHWVQWFERWLGRI
jgi:VanZ family protein